MKLKVFADRKSQPSRAVVLFCKVNGIDFEEIRVDLMQKQQFSPEFKEINPMAKVPAIVDGRFKLFESHAILIYLACAFPGVADHWYPADLFKRAKIHSVLDWHHSNLRRGSVGLVLNRKLAPAFGLSLNPQAAAEAEKLLSRSLSKIESVWLKGSGKFLLDCAIAKTMNVGLVLNRKLAPAFGLSLNPQAAAAAEKLLSQSLSKIESVWLKGSGKFLLGSNQPSIADLSLVCELMQLEVLDDEDRNRLLGPHKKVQQWIESTKNATRPHFDEVHKTLYEAGEKVQTQLPVGEKGGAESSFKTPLRSKM